MAGLNVSIASFFNQVTPDKVRGPCEEFYAPEIRFDDPMVSISGRDRLIAYYSRLYENVVRIRFDVEDETCVGDQTFARWTMHLEHKRLRGGKPVVVSGCSFVRSVDGKAVYHRDYFDLGSMLYENLPLFGPVTRLVRQVAGGSH